MTSKIKKKLCGADSKNVAIKQIEIFTCCFYKINKLNIYFIMKP